MIEELIKQREELTEEKARLAIEKNAIDQKYSAVTTKIKAVDVAIQEQKVAESRPKITDHALLRYVERVYGVNVEAIRQRILDDTAIMAAIEKLRDGKFWMSDGTELRVVNKHIVTIIGAKDE